MPRNYTVEFEGQSITNANGDYDLFELAPADDKPVAIYGLFLSVSSEVGDAQDETLRYRVIRGHATTGNGTSTTPRPLDPNDAAAEFTAKTVGATIASAGTPINVHSDGFNVRAGLGLWLPEGSEWRASQADTLIVVRLMAAVADDLTMSGTLYVREG